MTVRIVLSCDGDWHGQPCRGAIPVGAVAPGKDGRARAAAEGWSRDGHRDLCPACTRREALARADHGIMR